MAEKAANMKLTVAFMEQEGVITFLPTEAETDKQEQFWIAQKQNAEIGLTAKDEGDVQAAQEIIERAERAIDTLAKERVAVKALRSEATHITYTINKPTLEEWEDAHVEAETVDEEGVVRINQRKLLVATHFSSRVTAHPEHGESEPHPLAYDPVLMRYLWNRFNEAMMPNQAKLFFYQASAQTG